MRTAASLLALNLLLRARFWLGRRKRPGRLLAVRHGGRLDRGSVRQGTYCPRFRRTDCQRRRPPGARPGRPTDHHGTVQCGVELATRLQHRAEGQDFRADRLRTSSFQGRPVPIAYRLARRGGLDFVLPVCRRSMGAANPLLSADVGRTGATWWPRGTAGGRLSGSTACRLSTSAEDSRPRPTIRRSCSSRRRRAAEFGGPSSTRRSIAAC